MSIQNTLSDGWTKFEWKLKLLVKFKWGEGLNEARARYCVALTKIEGNYLCTAEGALRGKETKKLFRYGESNPELPRSIMLT